MSGNLCGGGKLPRPAQLFANTAMDTEENKARPAAVYADEVLCANWHPLVVLLAEPLVRAQQTLTDAVDARDFLNRFYVCQRA